MRSKIIAFFNNKGGVGNTSLVYHLAWMYSDLGLRVLAADLDPQANLTSAFLDETRLEELWPDREHEKTIYGSLRPLIGGIGDITSPYIEEISDELGLIAGDLYLSGFEDKLSQEWPGCMDGKEWSFRVLSAFWRIIQKGAEIHDADVILMDLGPNTSAINRSALIASDYVVVPLSPDLFSLQGLKTSGPALRRWQIQWRESLRKKPDGELWLPDGNMNPIGYVVLQHAIRLDRPEKAYDRWIACIPNTFREAVLGKQPQENNSVRNDRYSLSLIKHHYNLTLLAQEAGKPMFRLQVADGAIGAHMKAVQDVYSDFKSLAVQIAKRINLNLHYPGI